MEPAIFTPIHPDDIEKIVFRKLRDNTITNLLARANSERSLGMGLFILGILLNPVTVDFY